MLELKDYQQRSLNALTRYFRACVQIDDPDVAFYQTTAALYGQGVPYRRISELPGLPYVCLRLPTGGGKTLLAAHSIGVAAGELLHTDHPLVLWLTPSNTIRQQTLKALQDLQHPYRQAVEAQAGRVTVCDLSDALALQPSTLSSSTTIIVATMQAFRVGDTEGRKVYEANGALMSHFSSAPAAALQGLEQYADGAPVPCLANVLRLHRPALIVDEAHNARTSLSFETLARFSPSCILEFTATPDTRKSPSNVLYTVSAAELKSAGMIKLPIELVTEADWRETVNQAVNKRSQLEEIARQERAETGEYIRPILLLQAQPRSQERQNITVEILEKHLLEDQRIPAGQIARATGSDYQIEGLDLSSPTCPISYIITVQALREGWDCPFAYVLCSVAELHAQTAVEQILGRVLRLPKAGSKCNPELNRAYAFVTSAGFEQAATSLKDALVQNGFDRLEADELIAAQPAGVQQIDFWPWLAAPGRQETPGVYLAEAPDLSALSTELAQQITYDPSASRLTVRAGISSEQGEMLRNSFSDPSIQAVVSLAVQQARQPTDNRSSYVVPLLAVRQGSLVSQLDASYFLDRPIALARYSPFLDEAEYSGRNAAGQRGVIDIDASGRMRASYVGRLQAQLSFLSPDQSWSVMELAAWL
ncbi:MAG: DEAD/DEAH box helicase, partial [Chloroflexota bacterium]